MRWSKPIKKEHVFVDQTATVLDYSPREFNLGTPEAALDYLIQKEKGSDFVLSDVLRKTTGIESIERKNEEELIEQKVLEKVAEIQKKAYEEGFALGKEEGLNMALQKKTLEIEHGLSELNQAILAIQNLKPELVLQNETQFVKLVYQIASKLAQDHLASNNELILKVIKEAMNVAQAEEDVTIYLSAEQLAFVEQLKTTHPLETEFLEQAHLQASESVQAGGCIIETNYGEIDARTQIRFEKVWEEIHSLTPKITTSLSSEDTDS